ncbi:class III lanthipeptide, partial [Mammaliicoccus sciuri]|nr:class III lanthipeptide [Staphylococcus aureus]
MNNVLELQKLSFDNDGKGQALEGT